MCQFVSVFDEIYSVPMHMYTHNCLIYEYPVGCELKGKHEYMLAVKFMYTLRQVHVLKKIRQVGENFNENHIYIY